MLAPSSSCCQQDEDKKSDFKKTSLPAGHRMKNKPWILKTMKKPWFLHSQAMQVTSFSWF
jgi:hypothetical protein